MKQGNNGDREEHQLGEATLKDVHEIPISNLEPVTVLWRVEMLLFHILLTLVVWDGTAA